MRWLISLLFTFCACEAKVVRDLAYLDPLHALDLYVPGQAAKGGASVLIGIHGGGWAFGDKGNAGFVQPKAGWFNEQGILFVSINYRLSPKVTHPAHIEDVCKAVAVEGKTHGTINRDLGKPGDATTRAVERFLKMP